MRVHLCLYAKWWVDVDMPSRVNIGDEFDLEEFFNEHWFDEYCADDHKGKVVAITWCKDEGGIYQYAHLQIVVG